MNSKKVPDKFAHEKLAKFVRWHFFGRHRLPCRYSTAAVQRSVENRGQLSPLQPAERNCSCEQIIKRDVCSPFEVAFEFAREKKETSSCVRP
jgi:hypothetical protein